MVTKNYEIIKNQSGCAHSDLFSSRGIYVYDPQSTTGSLGGDKFIDTMILHKNLFDVDNVECQKRGCYLLSWMVILSIASFIYNK